MLHFYIYECFLAKKISGSEFRLHFSQAIWIIMAFMPLLNGPILLPGSIAISKFRTIRHLFFLQSFQGSYFGGCAQFGPLIEKAF